MSIIKSFAAGNGDMFYIEHGSDNFTIIDCCASCVDWRGALKEIRSKAAAKGIVRFISTHPDQDHLSGLAELDDVLGIRNFYCVANGCSKADETKDFKRYCQLRDDKQKAFYINKGCSRRWMNRKSDERGSSGLNILWPDRKHPKFVKALTSANRGESPNNLSPIIKYSLDDGITALWMADLETDFMEAIESNVVIPVVDVLFAPHHGRDSGRVPGSWLEEMDPTVIVIGEAPSKHLTYYGDYPTITQNSAGDMTLECSDGKVHFYVSARTYTVDFLHNERRPNSLGYYIGTLDTR